MDDERAAKMDGDPIADELAPAQLERRVCPVEEHTGGGSQRATKVERLRQVPVASRLGRIVPSGRNPARLRRARSRREARAANDDDTDEEPQRASSVHSPFRGRLYSIQVRFWTTLTVIAGCTLASAREAHADENVRRLAYNERLDTAITATAALWWIASEMMKSELVPEKCRWCYRTKTGDDALNRVDFSIRRALRWSDPPLAGSLSSWLAFVGLPALAIGGNIGVAAHDNNLSGAPSDILITTEATMLAVDLNQLVKYAFARERPFVHFLPRASGDARALTESPSDDNLSFYSGHTNLAFALATSAGTVSLMRGYRLAPAVLGVGLAGAFAVGYLRIAADKHYFSDVMVGAIVGSIVGVGVPLLFHRPSDAPSSDTSRSVPQALTLPPAHMPFGYQGTW